MCGIAGVLVDGSGKPPATEELLHMAAMLTHRGPDGFGIYCRDRLGLAHTRLSIIDLAAGHQPMSSDDGMLCLSYNGEVFNYVELRDTLRQRGMRFRTESDTEVVLKCFEAFGPDAWPMLNGQFAIALWDGRKRQLWLVRDGAGILPLYYAAVPHGVIFASEAKSLFAGGRIEARFDRRGLAETFTKWSAAAPHTVFEGVRSVRPGEAVVIDDTARITKHGFWQARFMPDASWRRRSLDDMAEELGHRLRESVRIRLRADVPVGAYLSGGLDSSVIARLASEQQRDMLETFAVRFTDARYDETSAQRMMAAHLGTRHHETLCDPTAIATALGDVVWHCETPLLRTAPAPLFVLSGLVRGNDMKVVLTGEGADELLAGYNIFKEDSIRRFWARQPGSRSRSALLRRLYPYVGGKDQRLNSFWERFFAYGLEDTDHPFYSHLVRWRNTAWTLRLLKPEYGREIPFETIVEEAEQDMPDGWRSWDPLSRAQMIEFKTFMSSYLLSCQGDRVAMAHSVEARYPFLDPNVMELCFALPKRAKLAGLRDKQALRHFARSLVPEEIALRPKQPYRAPVTPSLLSDSVRGVIGDILSEAALGKSEVLDGRAASHLIRKARAKVTGGITEREEMALVGITSLQFLSQAFGEGFGQRRRAGLRRLETMPCTTFDSDQPWRHGDIVLAQHQQPE